MTKILIADETGTLQDVGSIQNFVFDTMLPSNQYSIPIALSSGSVTYVAPDNGWVFVKATSAAGGNFIRLTNATNSMFESLVATGVSQQLGLYIPVLKGSTILIEYSVALNTPSASFIPSAKAISEQLDMDVDYVVESSPVGANPWYRRYKSGWVEQGGYQAFVRSIGSGLAGEGTTTFPVPMQLGYTANAINVDSSFFHMNFNKSSSTTTVLSVAFRNNVSAASSTIGFAWTAYGWAL